MPAYAGATAAAVQAFLAMNAAASQARLAQERCIQESHAHALGFYGRPGDSLAGFKVVEDPCDYCGRSSQTSTHRSCDGCGAPKHQPKKIVSADAAFGFAISRPGDMVKVHANTISADKIVCGTMGFGTGSGGPG